MANEKRLIDANELISAIDQYMKKVYDCPLSEIEEYQRNSQGTKCIYIVQGLCEAVEICGDVPTVDAVQVVHGRWVAVPSSDMMIGKAYKCSECNKMRYGSFMPNYCQNCGAKMDGGSEDG